MSQVFPLRMPDDPEDAPSTGPDDAPDLEALESMGPDPMAPDPERDATGSEVEQAESQDVQEAIDDFGMVDPADPIDSGGVAEDPTEGVGGQAEPQSSDGLLGGGESSVSPGGVADDASLLELIQQLTARVDELEQTSLRWGE